MRLYFTPDGNECWLKQTALTGQTQLKDAVIIVVEDFNSANLKNAEANLLPHHLPHCGEVTLDHC